jgi:hypothetical protein
MRDTNGNLATISLGGLKTVRVTSGGNANAHFFMFVPAGVSLSQPITFSRNGSNLSIGFPTLTGHTYTVFYNTTLVGGTWLPLGSPVTGDGTVKSVPDTLVPDPGSKRFYRLQIQ